MSFRAAGIALAACLIISSTVVTAPPAAASCATDHPAPSPYAFVGTVVDTKEDGYIATVITDSHDEVTVMGTEDTSWFSNTRSSVDRRYVLGARYEFHPTNASDPYRDNVCTATHKLAGPAPQPPKPAKDHLPAWLPVDEQAGPIGYAIFFVPVAAAALALVVVVLRARRYLQRTTTKAE